MNITPLSGGEKTTAAGGQTTRKNSLSQEDFMSLFVAQLRNQNPLQPMDNYQMASQMAQFSGLQALNTMSQAIQNMTAFQASINNLQVAGLIGKRVEAEGNRLSVGAGMITEGGYQLARPGKVTIKIYDKEGKLVRTLDEGLRDTSKQKILWDGKNQMGNPVPEGTYTFEVSAIDATGQSVSCSSWFVGTINGISFEDGITYLHLGSIKITISDIRSILG